MQSQDGSRQIGFTRNSGSEKKKKKGLAGLKNCNSSARERPETMREKRAL
jgi:hypothetical protein